MLCLPDCASTAGADTEGPSCGGDQPAGKNAPRITTVGSSVAEAADSLDLSRLIWLATTGRADEARATVDTEVERSAGRSAIAGSWLAMRSLDRLLDGDASRAAGDAGHAAAELADVDISLLLPFTLGIQATALAQMNRPADARRVLDQVEENWRSETKALLMSELAEA